MSASDELAALTAEELTANYKAGALTPLDATLAIFARIERLNPLYNTFTLIDASTTLEDARLSTERWRKGEPLSTIDGVPVAIKDLLWVKGWPTLRGSLAVNPKQPWTEDSPAAARLRKRGIIFLGKMTTTRSALLRTAAANRAVQRYLLKVIKNMDSRPPRVATELSCGMVWDRVNRRML